MKCVWYIPSLSGECSLGLQALEVGKVGCGGPLFQDVSRSWMRCCLLGSREVATFVSVLRLIVVA